MLNDIPHNTAVDLIITVYKMVTHVSNILPSHFWMDYNEIATQLIGRFTYNHSIVDNTSIHDLVRYKVFETHSRGSLTNGFYCI